MPFCIQINGVTTHCSVRYFLFRHFPREKTKQHCTDLDKTLCFAKIIVLHAIIYDLHIYIYIYIHVCAYINTTYAYLNVSIVILLKKTNFYCVLLDNGLMLTLLFYCFFLLQMLQHYFLCFIYLSTSIYVCVYIHMYVFHLHGP